MPMSTTVEDDPAVSDAVPVSPATTVVLPRASTSKASRPAARPDSLTRAQARRIAIAATGLTESRPSGAITFRHIKRVLDRVGLIQMDSVNVLQRAHYLPLYSRLGPYPTELLDRAAYQKPRRLFEYWGHEASLLPVELYPLMRWRMRNGRTWPGIMRIAEERPDLAKWVREEVAAGGPLTAAQIEADVPKPKGNWGWNWSDVKILLEYEFLRGEILVASRDTTFARMYDTAERVVPKHIRDLPTPADEEAHRQLVAIATRALGVASEAEIRDYFRMPVLDTRGAIRDLLEAGELTPMTIEGSKGISYLHRDAKIPRRASVATLVSPFDPIVWNRGRTERFFEFYYRIEIYVPAAKRVHGYYVLPFLLGDRFAARVDLKADRQSGVLRVPAVFAEPGAPAHTAEALALELRRMAGWLGLDDVEPPVGGDLAKPVAAALKG
jgi:uncharacterized protein YcaQ